MNHGLQEILNLEILLVIGAALVLAFIGASLLKRVGIPQILGFMLAGLVLGISPLVRAQLGNMQPIVDLALGLIGYNIGLEIRKDVFRGRTRQMGTILILESVLTFVIVTALTNLILGQIHIAIVFGAIASATDPASTVMVIWEGRCRGNLTDTLMFVLALDDVVAILLANVAISISVMFYMSTFTIAGAIMETLLEVGFAALVGGLFGAGMVLFINRESDRSRLLELELGMIILLVGLMVVLHASAILACMVFGFVVGNYVQPQKDPVSKTLKTVMSPIVMIFFVIVGATIDLAGEIALMGLLVIGLVVAYVFGRTFAKYFGAYVGAAITNVQETTKKYLGLCLMSQAGVAVGLALLVEYELTATGIPAAAEAGTLILSVVVITTLILQIFGPIAASIGLKRAGESPPIEMLRRSPLKQDFDPLADTRYQTKGFDQHPDDETDDDD